MLETFSFAETFREGAKDADNEKATIKSNILLNFILDTSFFYWYSWIKNLGNRSDVVAAYV